MQLPSSHQLAHEDHNSVPGTQESAAEIQRKPLPLMDESFRGREGIGKSRYKYQILSSDVESSEANRARELEVG